MNRPMLKTLLEHLANAPLPIAKQSRHIWTEEDNEYLLKHFYDIPLADHCKKFNTTVAAVIMQHRKLTK